MPRILRLTAASEEAVTTALEDQVEALHEDTCDADVDDTERADAERDMKCLVRVLEQIDPDHPLVLAPPKAGEAYDFDAAYDDDEDDDEGDVGEPVGDDGPKGPSPRRASEQEPLEPRRVVDAEFVRRA